MPNFDWRLSAAIAVMTFIVLTMAGSEGADMSPVWALLGGFAAALGIVILRDRAQQN